MTKKKQWLVIDKEFVPTSWGAWWVPYTVPESAAKAIKDPDKGVWYRWRIGLLGWHLVGPWTRYPQI